MAGNWNDWAATMDEGLNDKAWDAYDSLLQREIEGYNTRLKNTFGYAKVDWKLLKALLWIESGGAKNRAWKTRPMQIGNPGDPGYSVVKNGTEGSTLVMPYDLRDELKTKSINSPELNIRAGLAYVFTRMIRELATKTILSPKELDQNYTVVSGDTFEKIAKKQSSTVEALKLLNPGVDSSRLSIGQVIKTHYAWNETYIAGWHPFTTAKLQDRYNGNGDSKYSQKLDYVLELFKRLVR